MPRGGARQGAGRPKGRRNSEISNAQHVTAQHPGSPTEGRRRGRKRPPGDEAKRHARASQALDLRIAGATYRQIAAQLAVNERTVYYDVQQALATLDAATKDKAERLRDLEAARLDRLTVALAPGIKAGIPAAIMAAVRVMDRRAKLFGLDAPMQIAGPGGEAVSIRIVHQQLAD